MSGLLRRIRGARAAAPDPAPDDSAARSTEGGTVRAHHEATESGGLSPLPAGAGQSPLPADAEPFPLAAPGDPGPQAPARGLESLPAGVDLEALVGPRPTTQRRARLRRRLRHLRRVRELLLRDLGGLVFELHRDNRSTDPERSQVVRAKLERMDGLNAELRELEAILGDRRGLVVREPGIGGTCPSCGELFGSQARFCWACGTPVAPGAARALVVAAPEALPALGAAAKEGTPSNEWHAPEPHIEGSVEEIAEAPTEGAETPREGAATSADEQPTIERTRVHDDGRGPELRAGNPLVERRP